MINNNIKKENKIKYIILPMSSIMNNFKKINCFNLNIVKKDKKSRRNKKQTSHPKQDFMK